MSPRMKGGRWFRRDILAVLGVGQGSSRVCLRAERTVLLYRLSAAGLEEALEPWSVACWWIERCGGYHR